MARIIDFLRRVGAQPWLLSSTALLLRSRTVRQSPAFGGRELCGSRGCFRYELRQFPGHYVLVRHGTGDVVTLGEVFDSEDYAAPAELIALFGSNGPERILDLGANVGYAGAYFSAIWPQSEITAYEPDPANAGVHQQLIGLADGAARWRLLQTAAGSKDGEVDFVAGGVALSRIAEIGRARVDGEQLVTVQIDDVLPEVCSADLVKIDIEGGEWPILRDERFAADPPRALVMEYHPEGCGESNPRAAARRLLEAAGMNVFEGWERDHGAGMLWAWRQA